MGLFFSSSFHIMQCLDYSLNCEDIVGIGCCRVVSAFNNDTGAPAVGKLLDLTQDKATQLKFFYNEAQMLSKLNSLNCSHIVKMEKSGIVDKFGVIILERLEDDLLELILSTDLNINQKMQIFSEICFGIKECHDNGVAHLDIKPDNILISKSDFDEKFTVKLADFGGSANLDNNGLAYNVEGTLHYNAPEVFSQTSDGIDGKKADIWSLGIVLHILLTNTWPIHTNDPSEIRSLLTNGTVKISKDLSSTETKFIKNLLNSDVQQRPTIDEIIASDFFQSFTPTTPKLTKKRSKRGKRGSFLRSFFSKRF